MGTVNRRKRLWMWWVFAAALVVAVVGWLALRTGRRETAPEPAVQEAEAAAPQPAAKSPVEKEVAAPEAAAKVTEESPPVEEEAAEVDPDVKAAVAQATDLEPLTWKPPTYGPAKYFSAEDAAKAQALLDKYYGNFGKISTLSCRHDRRAMRLINGKYVATPDFVNASNKTFTRTVEASRSPMFLRMDDEAKGTTPARTAIVTEAGRKTSLRFQAESFFPLYMDGEYAYVRPLVQNGRELHEDVTMDHDLPGLEEYVNQARARGARYDMIVVTSPDGFRFEWYFNRETGMPDFIVGSWLTAQPGRPPLCSSTAWEYYNIDGIYYPKTYRCLQSWGGDQLHEHSWTQVVINGKSE